VKNTKLHKLAGLKFISNTLKDDQDDNQNDIKEVRFIDAINNGTSSEVITNPELEKQINVEQEAKGNKTHKISSTGTISIELKSEENKAKKPPRIQEKTLSKSNSTKNRPKTTPEIHNNIPQQQKQDQDKQDIQVPQDKQEISNETQNPWLDNTTVQKKHREVIKVSSSKRKLQEKKRRDTENRL